MEERYHTDEPWSFGNSKRILQYENEVTKKSADEFLAQNESYTRFRQHRKSKNYSPIYVYKKRELFQADVVFFTDENMVKENDGHKYLFTCIDCFTKMAWVFPIKQNNCDSAMASFRQILENCGDRPERLNSDRGSELICKKFGKYLSDMGISHYLSYSLRKCPVVERFNLTIQNLLYKIMAFNRSLKWTEYLEQAMHIYLNRIHNTIKMTPTEAENPRNSPIVRQHLLTYFYKTGKKKKKARFKVNDTVRIWSKKRTFQRGYDENFSIEYFKIKKVKSNLPVPRYILQDSKGETIIGSFFEDELVRFDPQDRFDIQVLRERKRGRKIEYFVHYIGYPNNMNEWISKRQLLNLK
jgi:hypothetical protein